MNTLRSFFILLIYLGLSFSDLSAQKLWKEDQHEILKALDKLSATTAPGGYGADEYATCLSADFSRWTIGSNEISNKKNWVQGIREWFDQGWRVVDRKSEIKEIKVETEFAFSRRIVREYYKGPNGEKSNSKAALIETWRKENDHWLLYRVEVYPMPADQKSK